MLAFSFLWYFPCIFHLSYQCCEFGFGIRCFFTPGTGMEKIRIRDKHSGSYFRELSKNFLGLKILNFALRIQDPVLFWHLDPGWEKPGSGILDKHPGSATLVLFIGFSCIFLYSSIFLFPALCFPPFQVLFFFSLLFLNLHPRPFDTSLFMPFYRPSSLSFPFIFLVLLSFFCLLFPTSILVSFPDTPPVLFPIPFLDLFL